MKDLKNLTASEIEKLKYGEEPEEKEYTKEELAELRQKAENGEALTDEESSALHKEDNLNTIKDVDSIIRGYNDKFVKQYHFNEDKINFTIKLKVPNIVEAGKIEALRERYLDGMGLSQTNFVYNAFDALATIRVVGEDVPKELAKDSDIYTPALEWLFQIDVDFTEWMARFHS